MTSPRGIVYIATGEPYLTEMRRSVDSVRTQMPEVPITCFTDSVVEHPQIKENIVLNDVDYDFGDSILDPEMLRYEKTLFLDADTHVCGDVSDIFKLLGRFDLAAAHNPERQPEYFEDESAYEARNVPDSFPQYNTGVLGLQNNNTIQRLLEEWQYTYNNSIKNGGYMFNQPAFRETLYNSDASIATLPPEYNIRINRCGYLNGPTKILHGRHPEMTRLNSELNQTVLSRVFTLRRYPIQVIPHDTPKTYRFFRSLRKDGIRDTIKKLSNII